MSHMYKGDNGHNGNEPKWASIAYGIVVLLSIIALLLIIASFWPK